MEDTGVRAIRFWTEYIPQPDGELKEVDKVEYCGAGAANRATTVATWRSITALRPIADQENDMAAIMAHAIRDSLEPAYKAWKFGQEIPETGTPLAAWPAVSADHVKVFQANGIRTVEEIANMPEQIRQKIPLPGLIRLQDMAKSYLENKDRTRVDSAIAERDAEIAQLKEQVKEMYELMSATTEPQPKKRGKASASEPDLIEDAAA